MTAAADFMVINFEATGEVTAMHRDEFSLGFLGKQQIERASEIKFNEETQKWDIYLPQPEDGPYPGMQWVTCAEGMGFAEYNGARRFEVLWLETCALYSVNPLSGDGRALGRTKRAEFKE
jgi:hypothetical protein